MNPAVHEEALRESIARLKDSMTITELAEKAYDASPTRENKIALFAARRMLRESIALGEEWKS